MLGFAITVAVITVAIVLLPFVLGKEGTLASAQSLNSIPQLEQVKAAIVKRFIEDEQAYHDKQINKFMWERRRMYLVNRYIDAARRLDFLRHLSAAGQRGEGTQS
jgi:hypothetical protein